MKRGPDGILHKISFAVIFSVLVFGGFGYVLTHPQTYGRIVGFKHFEACVESVPVSIGETNVFIDVNRAERWVVIIEGDSGKFYSEFVSHARFISLKIGDRWSD